MTPQEADVPVKDEGNWVRALRQYDQLVSLFPGRTDNQAKAHLEQAGVMRLAARYGFFDLLACEGEERREELTSTLRPILTVRVEMRMPLVEALTGPGEVADGITTGSPLDRVHCVGRLLQIAPEAANMVDNDGRTPLELASFLNNDAHVQVVLPYTVDVNAGLSSPLYWARAGAAAFIGDPRNLQAAHRIERMLTGRGAALRRNEAREIDQLEHPSVPLSGLFRPPTFAFRPWSPG